MVVSKSALDGIGVEGTRTGQLARTGGATVWAAIAVIWLIVAIQALVRWVLSPDFGPAPLLGPDRMPTWNLVGLRVFEGVSLALLMGLRHCTRSTVCHHWSADSIAGGRRCSQRFGRWRSLASVVRRPS